jgi:hypothetical protein
MHTRCAQHGITDFSLRTRMFRALAEPVLTYGAEVWGPDLLGSMDDALKAPLQVLQNDYVRHLGGVRRSVPATILCAESGLPPLARAWLRAGARQWNRMVKADEGIIKWAFVGDLSLARSLSPARARRTWSGAWLHALDWLAAEGGAPGAFLAAYAAGVHNTLNQGSAAMAGLRQQLGGWELHAWDHALANRAARAVQRGGACAEYEACFAAGDADEVPEAGFPSRMPYYFRHTSRFRNHQHARALMRLRCCSPPFSASPTLHYNTPTHCPHCDGLGRDETAEHALLDCPAYADLRAEPRFAPLFANLPALARMRAFARSADQHTLGAFVHACFERRTVAT